MGGEPQLGTPQSSFFLRLALEMTGVSFLNSQKKRNGKQEGNLRCVIYTMPGHVVLIVCSRKLYGYLPARWMTGVWDKAESLKILAES